jgi:hypothetical protein
MTFKIDRKNMPHKWNNAKRKKKTLNNIIDLYRIQNKTYNGNAHKFN